MTEETSAPVPAGFSKHRIEALNDGIFAIAMTLLVLGIEVPKYADPPAVNHLLMTLIPDIIHYVVAFLALAILWILHHQQFHYIRFIDHTLLWLNIMWLMLVGLVPFSTSLADTYYGLEFSRIPFALNLLFISLLLFAQWRYAVRKRELIIPGMTGGMIVLEQNRIIVILLIMFFGTLLSFISIIEGIFVYLLIPLIFAFFPMMHSRVMEIANRRDP